MAIFEVEAVKGSIFFESSHVVAYKIKKGALQSTQHSPFNNNRLKYTGYRLRLVV